MRAQSNAVVVVLVLTLASACGAEDRDSLARAVDLLSADIGEPITVDHCPPLPDRGTVVCAAHLESGVAFDLAVTRRPGRLDVHTVGMAAGRDTARKLYATYAARGLALPDMRCPALIRVGGEAVTCRTTVHGVPVAARAKIADGQISFKLASGVIVEKVLTRTIERTFAAGESAVVECGFDLRLSMPGTVFACGLAPRSGGTPRVAWVRIEDTAGRVTMSGQPFGS